MKVGAIVFFFFVWAVSAGADHFGRGRADADGVEGHSASTGATLYLPAPRSGASGEGDGTGAVGAKPGAPPPKPAPREREWFLFIVTGPRPLAGKPDPTRALAAIVKESADALVVHQQPFDAPKLIEAVTAQKRKLMQGWDRLGGAVFLSTSDIASSERDRSGVTARELEHTTSRIREILFPSTYRQLSSTRDLTTVLLGGKAGQIRCPFPAGELFRLTASNEPKPLSTLLHWLSRYADLSIPPPLFPRTAADWFAAWEPLRPRWLLPALCGLRGEIPKAPPRVPSPDATGNGAYSE